MHHDVAPKRAVRQKVNTFWRRIPRFRENVRITPRALRNASLVFLLLMLFLNIGVGAVEVTPRQILAVIGKHIWGLPPVVWMQDPLDMVHATLLRIGPYADLARWLDVELTRQVESVVWSIRLPRTLMATAIGAGLAVSGATMQGMFRNPLADPGLIGVSTGATIGAMIGIVFGFHVLGLWSVPVSAFLGACGVTALVYGFARHRGRTEVVTLLLAGVAITAIGNAAIGLLMSIANDNQLRTITFWTLGSLSGSRWNQVGVVSALVLIGSAMCWSKAKELNLLSLGEREARHLGVEVESLRVILVIAVAITVGGSVAFSGTIAFVGLVVPHLVRLLIGPDHRVLIPLSAIVGSTLLLAADLASRTLASPAEFPIGVTMSLVGGPFFLWLLLHMRDRQGGWG